MNRQLAVNDAVAGIVAQGGFSMDDELQCRYRGPDGYKCAVGHLIPDSKCDNDIERKSLRVVASYIPKKYGLVDIEFLFEMQLDLHDHITEIPFDIKSYTKSVADFCEKHGLDMPLVLVEQSA